VGSIRIGLTGGLCCGKSKALEIFALHGFEAVDLARYLHEALQGSDRIKSGLRRRFGDDCVDAGSGQVLSDKLSRLLSQDVSAQSYLENLIYPEVELLWTRDLSIPSVVEIPLLFEQHLEKNFHYSLCIYSSYAQQLRRAEEFRGWSQIEFNAKMQQQMPLLEKIFRSDFAIGNNGTLLQLERQIQQLLRFLRANPQRRG
jgi:dephospho-CoA kinase